MNKRYIDKNYVLIAVAVSVTLAVIIAGLITAVIFTARARQNDEDNDYAVTIYMDSVSSLDREIDKLVLCKESAPREKVASSALIAAAKCQVALDLTGLDYHAATTRQEFFNDAIAVLSGDDETVVQYAASLKSACALLIRIGLDGEFVYTPMLPHNAENGADDTTYSDARQQAAIQAVKDRLNATGEIIGDYGGKTRLEIARNDSRGYAVVDNGGRVCEFALCGTGENNAEENPIGTPRAVEIAKACGYTDMRVYEVATIGDDGAGITVKLCKALDGAMLIDECVTVSLSSNHTALRAADCCEHTKMKAAVSEKQAREYMGCDDCGVLVMHRHNGEDRLCYEYVIRTDSGSRRVYVCAQNGKQIAVE